MNLQTRSKFNSNYHSLMELDNEVTSVTILTGWETPLIVSSRGSGKVVVLWEKLSVTHGTERSSCLSTRFQKIWEQRGC
jgi:hypothetical protein